MYMDSLMQMVLQNSWQLPEVGRNPAADTGEGTTGPSFQELLEQSRDSQTKTPSGQTSAEEPEKVPQDGEEAVRPDQKEDVVSDVAMLDLSVLLRPQILTQEITPAVETGEGEGVDVLQGLAPVTVASNSGESAPAVQTEASVAQPGQTAQPAAEMPAEDGAVQALPTEDAAVPRQTESGVSEEPSQDLTESQSGRSGTGTDTGSAAVEGMQTPLFREVENTPVRVGDAGVDMTAPSSEVENTLSSVLKGAAEQGEQYVEIRLSPADLGTVVAEFTKSPEGVLHVVLHAENEHTAKLLGDHASALSLLLQDSGRGEVRVEVAQPQNEQMNWKQPDQDGGQHQQQQQQPRRDVPSQEAESFLQQLRLGLVEMEEEIV